MKIKNFTQFLNENLDEEIQEKDIVQDIDELDIDELDNDNLIELIYDKENEEWEVIEGDVKPPEDFEIFYDWFVEEVSEENTTVSMKEEDDEIVFYIPEDIYIQYKEEVEDVDDDEDIDDQSLQDYEDVDDF